MNVIDAYNIGAKKWTSHSIVKRTNHAVNISTETATGHIDARVEIGDTMRCEAVWSSEDIRDCAVLVTFDGVTYFEMCAVNFEFVEWTN